MPLSHEELLRMYRLMLVVRAFDDGAQRYYEAGFIRGTVHLSIGQEAVAVGACSALRKDDYALSNHRGHAHALSKGLTMATIMAELFGKVTGCLKGKGGSMHLSDFSCGFLGTNGIVGAGMPISVGVGLAIKWQKLDRVCLSFFGDGASNRGVFHESLNMASLWQLPVVFLCENNHFGAYTHFTKACAVPDIAGRAVIYGMPGVKADGTDVLAVYEAVKAAVDRARGGGGPTLLECVDYRWRGHSRGDKAEYRSPEEYQEWLKKDPIKLFKDRLMVMGVLDEERAKAVEAEVKQELEAAAEFAKNSPAPPLEAAFENVYAGEVAE